jgi:hypothetical protein
MKPKLQLETALERMGESQTGAQQKNASREQTDASEEAGRQREAGEPSFSLAVQTFSARKQQGPPTLPKLKPLNISEHRHAANPSIGDEFAARD